MDIDYSLALSFSKLAIDVFLKSTVLLVGVWLTVKVLRRHSASVHSLILAVVVVGLVLLRCYPTLPRPQRPGPSRPLPDKKPRNLGCPVSLDQRPWPQCRRLGPAGLSGSS